LTRQNPRPTLNPVGKAIGVGASRRTPLRPLLAPAQAVASPVFDNPPLAFPQPPESLSDANSLPQGDFCLVSPYGRVTYL